jgi:hypothetical protein
MEIMGWGRHPRRNRNAGAGYDHPGKPGLHEGVWPRVRHALSVRDKAFGDYREREKKE